MKLLKKSILLTLVAPLLFSLLSFNALGSGNEVLIIRIYENVYDSRIVISSKDKTTKILLEREKNEEIENKNLEVVAKTLEQYFKEDYKMLTSNSVQNSNGGKQVTTYILTK
jgi:hypothetical protein